MVSASSQPLSPVAALALPELRITAAAWPPLARRCDRDTVTGAAVIRLLVNTPAADTGRPSSVATNDRSSAPLSFTPAGAPAATKPWAEVMLMDRSP